MDNFEDLNIFEVASLIWKAKLEMNPIVLNEEDQEFHISSVECKDGEIYINISKLKNYGNENAKP